LEVYGLKILDRKAAKEKRFATPKRVLAIRDSQTSFARIRHGECWLKDAPSSLTRNTDDAGVRKNASFDLAPWGLGGGQGARPCNAGGQRKPKRRGTGRAFLEPAPGSANADRDRLGRAGPGEGGEKRNALGPNKETGPDIEEEAQAMTVKRFQKQFPARGSGEEK